MKQSLKQFLKPGLGKALVFLALLILSVFVGFFRTSGCFVNEEGIRVCRECGMEGIFNPLLRPVSFLLGNLIQGLMMEGILTLCGASITWVMYFPLDFPYLYLLSCLAISGWQKLKKEKL